MNTLATFSNESHDNVDRIHQLPALYQSATSFLKKLDSDTRCHSYRVANLALGLAFRFCDQYLNLVNTGILVYVYVAALLHDVGKVMIPNSILTKPSKLTCQEWKEMKLHPIFSAKILSAYNLPRWLIRPVLRHHECLDGSGYPFGLKGQDICLAARVITIADVFDAITSERAYRHAMSVGNALYALKQGAAQKYDSRIVNVLVDWVVREVSTHVVPLALPAPTMIDLSPLVRRGDLCKTRNAAVSQIVVDAHQSNFSRSNTLRETSAADYYAPNYEEALCQRVRNRSTHSNPYHLGRCCSW